MSNPQDLVPELRGLTGALYKATGNGSVPKTTISLMHLRAGQIACSSYLTMMHSGNLRTAGESDERLAAVATWRDAPDFTDAERVALALVEAVLLPCGQGEKVSDDLYAEASKHYDEEALATLAVAIGQVCFWIPVAVIGKPIPGKPAKEQWS